MDTIVKAVQRNGYIDLMIKPQDGAEYPYALYENDPYGDAPALREELARMVEAGEIVIEPEPPPAQQ